MIRFGPAGLGPVKTALETLDSYAAQGIRACEVSFTYGAYIKKEEDARAIGAHAQALDIALSIHGSYFINLNAAEAKKRDASMQRILECCKVGHWLGAKHIVFHPGYYGVKKEEAHERIKESIMRLMTDVRKQKWDVLLAPEIMGKVNVFGSAQEVARLVRETGCSFCIDFAHLLAREKAVDYTLVKELFPQPSWHVHFSGIIYGDKGEKSHRETEDREWKALLKELPHKEITIINESPVCVADAVRGLSLWQKMR